MTNSELILNVRNLTTSFQTPNGEVIAVNDLSFSLADGETLAIVGESGCGKSVTSFSLMRLLASQARVKGQALLSGHDGRQIDLLQLSGAEMEKVRGRQLGMIFQEPMTSLNPLNRIGNQIGEAMLAHGLCSSDEARQRAVGLLEMVGIADPNLRARQYPHQMSGGMRQRVMIAIALACKPRVLIADEPTTALDVTIQAQILRLIRRLQREAGMGVLFITHDMGVVSQVADRVAVMYGGQLVETGSTRAIFTQARHPYTRGLLASVPNPKKPGRLVGIAGQIETIYGEHVGCRFFNRCALAADLCHRTRPSLSEFPQGHQVRCHFADRTDTP